MIGHIGFPGRQVGAAPARDFFRRLAVALVVVTAILLPHAKAQADTPAAGAALPVLPITVFVAPSYSVWLPTLIVQNGIDVKHGFKLVVTQKPGTTAYLDFATGVDKNCFCIVLQTFAPLYAQGADVTLLFNVFRLTNFVATTDPGIHTPRDLEGKRLAAATGTGPWALSSFLLRQDGVDLSKVDIETAPLASQVAELATGQVDAILPGPMDMASLQTETGGRFHIVPAFNAAAWQALAPGPGVPNIGFGVSRSWIKDPANLDLVRRFYAAIQEAGAFAQANPERAADIIGTHTAVKPAAVLYALKHFPDILDIRPIGDYRASIKLLTQKILPDANVIERPLTDAEVAGLVSDFHP